MEREVMALVWLHEQGQMSDAELIVRMARPSRWRGARFAGGDVERAARSIERDPRYRGEVYVDAARSADVAGCGREAACTALGHLMAAAGEAS